MEENNDIYMDTVRFISFVNLVLSYSERKETYSNLNKIQSSYKLCKNKTVFCSICISDVFPTEYIRELKCKHTFHKKCVDKWLKKCIIDEIEVRCPICRTSI